MNKFFRKYNKWLLAVFGSGLMVIFLMPEIPSLVSNMGLNQAVIATVDGEAITREELIEYQEQAKVIDRMQSQGALLIPYVGKIDGWEQWYLLVREARQAGMIGGFSTSPLSEEQTIQFARGFAVTPQVIQQTWTNYIGVANYLGHLRNSAPLSDRRLRRDGRRLFDTATAQVVSVKADTPADAAPPSEESLQAHLDLWGDTLPGEGEHGFGYRLPNRVALEWLTIPNEAIRTSLESSDSMNEIDLLKYWRRNEGEGGIPSVEVGSEIPEVVRNRMLDELAEGRRKEINRKAADQLRTPRRGFDESGGFVILPDDWNEQRLALADLRDLLQEEYGIELPDLEQTESLTPLNKLRLLQGIGLATTPKFGQSPVNLPTLMAQAKEFNGNGLYPVQEGVAGPVLNDRQNNLYVFRVEEADAARSPADVDEIREQLVLDLNRLAHYEDLLETTEALRERSRSEGLQAIADEQGARVQSATFRLYDPRFAQIFLQNQGTMPRSPQIIPGLGEDPDVVSTVLDRVNELDVNGSLLELAPEDRIDVIPSEQNLALVIVELKERNPLTIDEFTSMTESQVLSTLILQDELGEEGSIADAFTLEALMERNQFVQPRSTEDDEADAEIAEQPTGNAEAGS